MEEPDAAARGREDHVSSVRLEREDSAGYGGVFMAAAPGAGDDGMVRGAQGCLSREEDEEKVTEKEGGFAVELVKVIFAPFDGSSQIGEEKGSCLEERPIDVCEGKGANLPLESREHAEFGNLRTCHVANGGLADKSLCVTFGETFRSKDDRCRCDVLCEREDLSGSQGEWGDLQTIPEEAHCDNKVLLDSMNHGSKQWLCGVNGMIFVSDVNNDLKQDDLMPKIEAEDSRPAREDSVPSVSGRIDVSLDGKAGCVGEISSDSVACHVAVGGMGNKGLCTTSGGGSQHNGPGCMYDTVDKTTKGNQCDQSVLVREGGVLLDGLEVKRDLEDLQMCCRELHCDNEGLSDLGKHDIDKLPSGADDLRLMTDANHELHEEIFLPNIDADMSWPLGEAPVPFIYENPTDVPLDGRGSGVGEKSENRTCLEKVACNSLGGDMLSCESDFQTDTPKNDNQNSWIEVSKGSASSVCTQANIEGLQSCDAHTAVEVPFQQTDKKYRTSESLPERHLSNSPRNLHCEDKPCSGREFSVLCLGSQVSVGVELNCSEHLVQELDANSAVGKPSSVDFVKNGNDEELQNQKAAPLIVFRRRNPRRAASSRNLNNHDQSIKVSDSTRRSKKVERSSSSLRSTIIKFPNKITKGRSVRLLKSSSWGSLQKVMDGFGQKCGLLTSNSDLNCLEKGISNGRSDEKTQPCIRRSRSSRSSKGKCAAFADIGYALNELNWQHTFAVTTDSNASSEGHIGNVPKSSHALINVSDDAHGSAQCIESNDKLKLMAIETDRKQLGRVLESITQETCPAYIQRDCAISTSEPSLNNVDIGFSPDSVLEVACAIGENNICANHEVVRENLSGSGALTGGGLNASALCSSESQKDHASSSVSLEQQAETVRGNENTRMEEINPYHSILDNDIGEGKENALKKSNTEQKNKKLEKLKGQKKDGTTRKNMKNRSSTKISSSEVLKLRAASNDSSSLDPSDWLLPTGPPKFDSSSEILTSDIHEHDSVQGPSVTDNEKSLRHNTKDGHRGKKGKVQDPHAKGKSKKKDIANGTSVDRGPFSLSSLLSTDQAASHMKEKGNLSPGTEVAFKSSAATSTELPRNDACKTDAAWVCCDDCQKWRCIPAELADIIQESRWTCKDNRDKAFADCSIPQEKSNTEINAELDLSDASADEADNDGSNLKASRAPSWTHVRSNLFLHRNRKTQSIDEIMVCSCKPPQDGRMGCRDGCLNRMLNIECVKRACPCGDHCSNQQFQRRSYAKLNWIQSGKKGYGLQLQEDVSKGQFLIEYVGEVLNITAYESRQRYYASKGQKHFYFMALNGGEVIDACTKGNLGRFINHSCSPNCCTEKWIVNGEVCIGIFATRNIRKGEELTFDYNYVRVSGAAAQKCFCGTTKCRGYIGGDISGAEIISQDNAEAEHVEYMAAGKDVDEVIGANGFRSHSNADIVEHETFIQREDSNDCPSSTPELKLHQQTAATVFDISERENPLEVLSPQDAEDARTPVHVSRTIESSWQSEYYLQKTPNTKDGSETPNVMNRSAPSSDLGSNLAPGFYANKKNNIKLHRNVKPSSSPIDNVHTLEVEGTLNKLLDDDGGINKRKDSTNGYLKLLVMTAAEGDNAGGTSNSVRNLSLILDALLKTKSRAVLFDVIRQNGLQMLHNILKQNRDNFHRIPIIRKLLKVLEFLASEDILTPRDINSGPRCAGMESFRDSMLSLVYHKDTQVHQIARNFRDRWFPRNIGRSEPTEHPHTSTSAQDIQGSSAVGGLVSTSVNSTDWNFTRRKRKSRWDYQPDDHYRMVGLKIQKVLSGHSELDPETGLMRNKLQGNWGTNSGHNNVPYMGSSTKGENDEAPPGFESQQECQPAQALFLGVAPGFCLERYQHNLSISYGIPVAFVEHFGTPENGGQCRQKWKVAPGVPFNPFPPLPPYPRGGPCPSTSPTQMSQHNGTLAVKQNSSGYCGRTMNRGGRMHRYWRNGTRAHEPYNHQPYNHQGRRLPSNHHRLERCWPSRP